MPETNFKRERDRYLAFSLAAADLLVTVNDTDEIVSIVGAPLAMFGEGAEQIKNRHFFSFFSSADQRHVARLLKQARAEGRIAPCVVSVSHGDQTLPVNLGMTYIGDLGVVHATVSLIPQVLISNLPPRAPESGLIEGAAFQRIVGSSRSPKDAGAGGDMLRELRMLRLQGLPATLRKMPATRAQSVMAEIGAILRCVSADGGMAGQLDEDQFGYVVPPGSATAVKINALIEDVLQSFGAPAGSVKACTASITLDHGSMSADEAAKAISFAIDEFSRTGRAGSKSLGECLAKIVATTLGTVGKVRQALQSGGFDLAFQPIVTLSDGRLHHSEALIRFADGKSPLELVQFSEKVGIVADIDMAVFEGVSRRLGEFPLESFAVNISAVSLQNETFKTTLAARLKSMPKALPQLMFELTETAAIEDLEGVGRFLTACRSLGVKICIDDFGAGASGISYLRSFDVDYIKIDGQFLRGSRRSDKERALLVGMAAVAKELGVPVIAEMIEDRAAAEWALSLGCTLGQGYLYGKPELRAKASVAPARRLGASETWG